MASVKAIDQVFYTIHFLPEGLEMMRRTIFRRYHLRWIVASFVIFVVAGLFGLVQDGRAQGEGPSLRSMERPIRVSLDPTYQYYETERGRVLSELSTWLSAFVPIGDRVSVRAGAAYAQMGGDNLKDVRGLTDARGAVTYTQPAGDGSVVMTVQVNAPTGKSELTADELQTVRPISQNYYDFRVTSFSRGLSVAPRVTYAVPLTDRIVVGIGASYQHQRGFRPEASLQEDYVPGDGMVANGGADYKISESSAVGLDLSFRRYASDELGGAPRFTAGNQYAATARYLVRSGFTTIRAVARYASWEKSEFGYAVGSPDRGQVLPPHGMVRGEYQTRLTDRIRITARASGHLYGETVQSKQKVFGRVHVAPSFALIDAVRVVPHGTASYGSYLGLGGGMRIVGEF